MDVFDAIQNRKSSRSYKPTPVPKAVLEKLLDAARLSPSAKNLQPWHFIVVTDKAKRKALSGGMFARFLGKVPAVIVLCGDEQASPDWYVVDVALAGENMVLAATSEGLGTCWVGSFDEKQVQQLLKIPEHMRVVALLAVGYAEEKISLTEKIIHLIRRRKPLTEISSWEMYGQNPDGSPNGGAPN
ncbi:MAG: nitroreductase family protein [Candidatus Bathyarchaeota archaeon]|nr:nitroreductase family protein [Candidatus Bathyarchaeota archaeon]